MEYILVALLTIVHLVCGQPDYLLGKGWCAILTNQFFHANIFHLAVNCFSLVAVYRYADNRRFLKEMAWAYIISVAVFPVALKPIIGISNMIYAVIGMRTPPFSDRWWKSRNTITFLAVTALMAFIPSISAVTHIASFALGTSVAVITRYIRRIKDDQRKASHSR